MDTVLFPHCPDTSVGWMIQDLNEEGVVGDATDADQVCIRHKPHIFSSNTISREKITYSLEK